MADYENPYAPPEAAQPYANLDPLLGDDQQPLASRWARLGGAIVDGLLMAVLQIPAMIGLGFMSFTDPQANAGLMPTLIGGLLGLVIFLAINGYLLANHGQTVGKKLLGMRIVDYDTGEVPTFGKVYGIRYLLVGIITHVPIIGGFFWLIDTLFIFREDKRCIHDLMANTEVVET